MGFLAFHLNEDERANLLEQIPPAYPRVVADHVTIQLKKPDTLPEARHIDILGVADDGNGLQALVVSVDGERARPDGKPYHITWSLDPEKTAPAEYDPNPKPEKRKPMPCKPMHSGGMIGVLEAAGGINWFDSPIGLGPRSAVFVEDAPAAKPGGSALQAGTPTPR